MRWAVAAAALAVVSTLCLGGCRDPGASQAEGAAKAPEVTIPGEIAQPARRELLGRYSGTAAKIELNEPGSSRRACSEHCDTT